MRVGVDAGGTSIKAGLVSRGKVIKFLKVKAPHHKDEYISALINVIEKLWHQKVTVIGIGIPGPADYKEGIIGKTPNIPLGGVNLKLALKRFKVPIKFENDAVCFALGEAKYGIAAGKKVVVGITLGTGVGGGIIVDGKPFKGQGNAGHVCQIVICDEYSNDKFFKFHTLESRCSARAFHASPKLLQKSAEHGNRQAIKAFDDYGKSLGVGIGTLIGILDPDMVVVGGGLAKSWHLFKDSMKETIKQITPFKANVVKFKLKHSALLGAAGLDF